MKVKTFLATTLISAIGGAIVGSQLSWNIETWQCGLVSPGADKVCRLENMDAIWRGVNSGFILGGAGSAIVALRRRASFAYGIYERRRYLQLYPPVKKPKEDKEDNQESDDFNWDWLSAGLVGATVLFALSEPVRNTVGRQIDIATTKPSVKIEELFATPKSVGNLAICAAEGNCLADGSGKHSSLYLQGGHYDPANGVFNRGFCSDQGRGKDMTDADTKCVQRMQSRLSRLTKLFSATGVPAESHVEAFINATDQWNQASPRVSDNFAKNYATALRQRLPVSDAIALARVESFRNWQGQLDASGLRRVCSNWTSSLKQEVGLDGLEVGSETWMKNCIGYDQGRRQKAIKATLQFHSLPSSASSPRPKQEQSSVSNTLVDIKQINPRIVVAIPYATPNNFLKKQVYPVNKCLLLKPVAENLSAVQEELEKRGLGLKVWDCYRPLSVQKKMWKLLPDPRYVANPAKGSNHNRGTAIDLTLVDSNGKELKMPTRFDDFTEKAHRSNTTSNTQALRNSKLLETVMEKHRFTSIQTEWWHFDNKSVGNAPVLNEPIK